MLNDKMLKTNPKPRFLSLPDSARLPINHCNLPADILGSLTFQQYPTDLLLDGVNALHHGLFSELDKCSDVPQRGQIFMNYMQACFQLATPEEAGAGPDSRYKANYLRLLRGWMFDADEQEAAVLKAWIESRFGLLTRYHKARITSFDCEPYYRYIAERSQGLYNTNALEMQLDLLYSYCQYELAQRISSKHLSLYRGINHFNELEILQQDGKTEIITLLNNLNSFTNQYERASEFGDIVLKAQIPYSKIVWFPELLSGRLQGEQEYIVIGGLYRMSIESGF
ncbi:NAD(+)--dinitrogen-reductase ADP-D-ribosyltransferase [hydrothermal vent metagenome]|uniref:NAD(+)--dinitrogen-reductase ADP-D-ribosyltransferase n=1 Tax=hydrothermal vent metagenome TaxID=652676 RepID=A0A3B1BKM9_9ZZZZ